MEKVTLKFPSIIELWAFKRSIGLSSVVIVANQSMLHSSLPKEQVNVAVNNFGAKVITESVVRKPLT